MHSLLLLGFFGRCGHSFSGPSNRALVSQGFESHLFFIKWKETRQHFFCLTMGGWELNVDTQLVYILKKIQNIVWLHYFFIFPLPLWLRNCLNFENQGKSSLPHLKFRWKLTNIFVSGYVSRQRNCLQENFHKQTLDVTFNFPKKGFFTV